MILLILWLNLPFIFPWFLTITQCIAYQSENLSLKNWQENVKRLSYFELPKTKSGNIDVFQPLPGPWEQNTVILIRWSLNRTALILNNEPKNVLSSFSNSGDQLEKYTVTIKIFEKFFNGSSIFFQNISEKYAYDAEAASFLADKRFKTDGSVYYVNVTLDSQNYGTSGPFEIRSSDKS
ncbi:hypothetical protein G9A89_005002 [Geosiphon pyriformis]|nr:hypothetical protein G9A89_005002 [Geosiphon pyriformis]